MVWHPSYPDTIVPWYHDTLVPWYPDTLVPVYPHTGDLPTRISRLQSGLHSESVRQMLACVQGSWRMASRVLALFMANFKISCICQYTSLDVRHNPSTLWLLALREHRYLACAANMIKVRIGYHITTWGLPKTFKLALPVSPWCCLIAFNRGYIRKGLTKL